MDDTIRPFSVFKGADGQHYVHLQVGNGQILLSSEGYTRQEDAFRAARTARDTVRSALAIDSGQ